MYSLLCLFPWFSCAGTIYIFNMKYYQLLNNCPNFFTSTLSYAPISLSNWEEIALENYCKLSITVSTCNTHFIINASWYKSLKCLNKFSPDMSISDLLLPSSVKNLNTRNNSLICKNICSYLTYIFMCFS